ncbi:hypothetical protein KI427_18535 [Rhodococcus ruber]|uniref:hypothetical protein n=1 Tax=Rhodococcus TaxID=1827 RepID=UPI000AAFAAA5|nr:MULTISPECIES: hypothetical protein [Rhodococcus]UIR39243.1 hypothetical protein LZP97_12490 [Rhodococcus sp. DMF-1]UQB71577.1 hypothetical protein KI427_18535 [Rhodococcus ruber]WML61397.1 hypothetical protein QNA09_16125 [Rhodococcus sp. AH-ZY2]
MSTDIMPFWKEAELGYFAHATGLRLPAGFVPTAIPRTGLNPLDVFSQHQQSMMKIGDLTQVLDGTTPLAEEVRISTDRVSDIAGNGQSTKRIGLAVSALNQVVQALGYEVTLKGTTRKDAAATLSYQGVTLKSANTLDVDRWIRNADLNYSYPLSADLAVNERIHIALGAYYARELCLTVENSSGIDIEVTPADLGEVRVENHTKTGRRVSIMSKTPFCIAVHLVKLFCHPSGFWISGSPSGRKRTEIRSESARTQSYSAESVLFEMS